MKKYLTHGTISALQFNKIIMNEQERQGPIVPEQMVPPSPENTMRKSHTSIIVILIIIIVLIAGGCYFYSKNSQPITPVANNSFSIPSDWKTYRNEQYGFEFKYPGYSTPKIAYDNLSGLRVEIPLQIEGQQKFEKKFTITIDNSGSYPNFKTSCESGPSAIKDATASQLNVGNQDYIVRSDPGGWMDGDGYQTTYSVMKNDTCFIASIGGYWSYDDSPKIKYDPNTENVIGLQMLSTLKYSPVTNIVDTSKWETYKDSVYGFEFKYPSTTFTKKTGSGHDVLFSGNVGKIGLAIIKNPNDYKGTLIDQERNRMVGDRSGRVYGIWGGPFSLNNLASGCVTDATAVNVDFPSSQAPSVLLITLSSCPDNNNDTSILLDTKLQNTLFSTFKFTPLLTQSAQQNSNTNTDTDNYVYGFSDITSGKQITTYLGGHQDYFVRRNNISGQIDQLFSYDELTKNIPEMKMPGQRLLDPGIFVQPAHANKVFLNFLVEDTEGAPAFIYSYDIGQNKFAKLVNVSGIIGDSIAGDMSHLCDEGCAFNSDKTKFVMAKFPYAANYDRKLYLVDLMKDTVTPIATIGANESFDKDAPPYAFEIDVKWTTGNSVKYGVFQPVSNDNYYNSDIYKNSTTSNPQAPLIEYRTVTI